jgi:tetratricopeptide (TPR) repeat protein
LGGFDGPGGPPYLLFMKILAAALAVSLALATGPQTWAAAGAPVDANAPPQQPAPAPTRAEQLDALFSQLRSAKDPASATQTEDAIIALWLESGSDTVDLLMTWSVQAIAEKNYAEALDILDRIVTLKPDYAEAWNKRATVYFLTDQYGPALSDIKHVLVLEPRHFGALVGLGSILHAVGENGRAIDAFKEALALDPYLPSARKALTELEKETGQNI